MWLVSTTKKLLGKLGIGMIFDLNLLLAILMQFVLAGFVAGCLHLAFGWVWAAYMWGGTIVAILIGWTKWIQVWFAVLRFDYAAVYENSLFRREEPDRNTPEGAAALTTVTPSSSTRAVIGAAIIGTNPFQRLVRNKAINLVRALPITPEGIELLTREGKILYADIRVFPTAIRDKDGVSCLVQVSEEYIEKYITGYAKSWLEMKARSMSLDEIFSGLVVDPDGKVKLVSRTTPSVRTTGTLENGFKEFLGGKNVLHEIEKAIGCFTGDPTISIRLHPDLLSALQAQAIAGISADAIRQYTSIDGMDPNVAANIESSIRGKPQPVQVIKAPPGFHYVGDARQGGR